MHVFLDTNVFQNNWYLGAATFKFLARYLNNEGHSLLISRLVCEETQNLRRRALDSTYQQMEKVGKEFARLTGSEPYAFPDRTGLPTYDLASLLGADIDKVVLVEYDAIPQSVVASRAMSLRRPFREHDKGYRDTLIWLSLLEHLSKRDDEQDVAFITLKKHLLRDCF